MYTILDSSGHVLASVSPDHLASVVGAIAFDTLSAGESLTVRYDGMAHA